jgi:hypothetical protein
MKKTEKLDKNSNPNPISSTTTSTDNTGSWPDYTYWKSNTYCIYTNKCFSYPAKCNTCKNNKADYYEPDPSIYPTSPWTITYDGPKSAINLDGNITFNSNIKPL